MSRTVGTDMVRSAATASPLQRAVLSSTRVRLTCLIPSPTIPSARAAAR